MRKKEPIKISLLGIILATNVSSTELIFDIEGVIEILNIVGECNLEHLYRRDCLKVSYLHLI